MINHKDQWQYRKIDFSYYQRTTLLQQNLKKYSYPTILPIVVMVHYHIGYNSKSSLGSYNIRLLV